MIELTEWDYLLLVRERARQLMEMPIRLSELRFDIARLVELADAIEAVQQKRAGIETARKTHVR